MHFGATDQLLAVIGALLFLLLLVGYKWRETEARRSTLCGAVEALYREGYLTTPAPAAGSTPEERATQRSALTQATDATRAITRECGLEG